jgi:PEGA domain/PKD domain
MIPKLGSEAISRRALSVTTCFLAVWLTYSVATLSGVAQVFNAPQGRADNVRYEPSGGGVITITYDLIASDLRASFEVVLEVSRDGGRTFDVKPASVRGDVGKGIGPGTGKKIVWEASKDVETVVITQLRFRVTALSGAAIRPHGTLKISSDPSGATVLIDGQERGRTPVTLDIEVGSHLVRILREGYLENGRRLSVDDGATEIVDVTLTKVGQTAQSVKGAGGSNHLKWILPLVGGAGAGIAIAATRSKDSTPVATNHAPTLSAITIVLPSDGGTGLQGATNFRFTATGSDSDNDAVTLAWDFNDGSASATGPDVSHLYNTAGSFVVKVTATDAKGGTDTKQQVVAVASMGGTWVGVIGTNPSINFTMALTQATSGTAITGTYSDTNGNGAITSPGLSDVRNVSLRIGQGARTIDVSCKGDTAMKVCAGNVNNAYTAPMTMSRQ